MKKLLPVLLLAVLLVSCAENYCGYEQALKEAGVKDKRQIQAGGVTVNING